MTPKQILLDAADLLETKGWTQGTFARDEDGVPVSRLMMATCFCALGAIVRVSSSHSDMEKAKIILDNHVGKSVIKWNDAEDQTAENVIKTMREAANAA